MLHYNKQGVKVFSPSLLLKNKHIQTLYATFFRKKATSQVEIERFELDDGDFLESYWYHAKPQDNRPIVTLFHGLEGSFESSYIQGMMKELDAKGFASVLMSFRGCSGKENLLPRSYHSGETSDAKAWLAHVKTNYPHSKLYAVGYSLGGNMLLKLLGEEKKKSLLTKAVAVSVPMDLENSATRINQGFSKLYQKHFIDSMKYMLLKKYDRFDMQSLLGHSKEEIKKIKTIIEFDEIYTAPIHGFASAKAYYQKSSSKAFLKSIQVPTLIFHALDDPFMTPSVLPSHQDEVSPCIDFKISKHGGHMGFVSGTLWHPHYWLEEEISGYFKGID